MRLSRLNRFLSATNLNEAEIKEARQEFKDSIDKPGFRDLLIQRGAKALEKALYGDNQDKIFPDLEEEIINYFNGLNEVYHYFKAEDRHADENLAAFRDYYLLFKLICQYLETPSHQVQDEYIDEYLYAYKMLALFGPHDWHEKLPLQILERQLESLAKSRTPRLADLWMKNLTKLPSGVTIKLSVWQDKMRAGSNAYQAPSLYDKWDVFNRAVQVEEKCDQKLKAIQEFSTEDLDSVPYDSADANPELQKLCQSTGASQEVFDACLRLEATRKEGDNLPAVTIDGRNVQNAENYFLVKMPAQDPCNYFVGICTHSSEAIGRSGEAIVKQVMRDPNAAYYVLLKRDNESDVDAPVLTTENRINRHDYNIVGHYQMAKSGSNIQVLSSSYRKSKDKEIGDAMLRQLAQEVIHGEFDVLSMTDSDGKVIHINEERRQALITEVEKLFSKYTLKHTSLLQDKLRSLQQYEILKRILSATNFFAKYILASYPSLAVPNFLNKIFDVDAGLPEHPSLLITTLAVLEENHRYEFLLDYSAHKELQAYLEEDLTKHLLVILKLISAQDRLKFLLLIVGKDKLNTVFSSVTDELRAQVAALIDKSQLSLFDTVFPLLEVKVDEKRLADGLASNGSFSDYFEAIYHLARNNDETSLSALLKHDASIDELDQDGDTPAAKLIAHGYVDAANLLMKLGADPSQVAKAHARAGNFDAADQLRRTKGIKLGALGWGARQCEDAKYERWLGGKGLNVAKPPLKSTQFNRVESLAYSGRLRSLKMLVGDSNGALPAHPLTTDARQTMYQAAMRAGQSNVANYALTRPDSSYSFQGMMNGIRDTGLMNNVAELLIPAEQFKSAWEIYKGCTSTYTMTREKIAWGISKSELFQNKDYAIYTMSSISDPEYPKFLREYPEFLRALAQERAIVASPALKDFSQWVEEAILISQAMEEFKLDYDAARSIVGLYLLLEQEQPLTDEAIQAIAMLNFGEAEPAQDWSPSILMAQKLLMLNALSSYVGQYTISWGTNIDRAKSLQEAVKKADNKGSLTQLINYQLRLFDGTGVAAADKNAPKYEQPLTNKDPNFKATLETLQRRLG